MKIGYAYLARFYPNYAAKARVSVRRSNNTRRISTISGVAGDMEKVSPAKGAGGQTSA
jgi:hypothetical protein